MHKVILSLIMVCLLSACAPSARMSDYDIYRFADHYVENVPAGNVKVTFLGTSTLLIDDGETQLLTDGFVSRPGLIQTTLFKIGSSERKVQHFVANNNLTRLKAIFCAHSHYDHAMDAPAIALRTGAMLHGSPSTLNIGRGAKLPEHQMTEYKTNVPIQIGKFTVTILPSKHTRAFKILGVSNKDSGVVINSPLCQPARRKSYAEGGAYDVLIEHHGRSMLIKASTNWTPGALDGLQADVVFLGIARLGKENDTFRTQYYNETIGKLEPKVVIPIHWDDFFKPLSNHLQALPKGGDNVKLGMDYMISRTKADGIEFHLMQGNDSVLIF